MFRSLRSRRSIPLFFLLALSVLLAACNAQAQMEVSYASIPAGKAYAEGEEIFFSHTEASDAAIADMLTKMMNSPVIHVPALAQVPADSLADVYVFENGVEGKGPLGFQPDVFDNPPGSVGYSPLRQVLLVKWTDGAKAAELKSEADILKAESNGELSINASGVVVNMPFMVWEDGKR